MSRLDLDVPTVLAMPTDRLALRVVEDFLADGEGSAGVYLAVLNRSHPLYKNSTEAQRALAEALDWARTHGLLAATSMQHQDGTLFVTRAGHRALKSGLEPVHAIARLGVGIHPLIRDRARSQFLLGEYEQAVFVTMKAVEIRVRELTGLGEDAIGVKLMNTAFGQNGKLTDPAAVQGEQEGTRALFAGAYAVLRNPSGHRNVDYDDVEEAAEGVATASLLMRILDRVEKRLTPP